MEVSTLKSKVLAGKPSIVAAVVERLDKGKLTLALRSKMLGTDAVGGSRRSTVTFCDRVNTFGATIPKVQALRKIGVNSLQMVRTAGTPSIMYGCEIFGFSDSALYLARSKVASAAAAPTGGKNIELLLHLLDGQAGTLDPAFEAHTAPLLMWAIAVWEGWFSREQLASAFTQASLKLAKKRASLAGASSQFQSLPSLPSLLASAGPCPTPSRQSTTKERLGSSTRFPLGLSLQLARSRSGVGGCRRLAPFCLD